ncbi:MAG: hypothetical protein ACFFCI_02290 [Promethearchaeota archaeon]
MTLELAKKRANNIIGSLAFGCQKIQVAGSIRREKSEVGDIEIVVIPKITIDKIQSGLGKFFDLPMTNEINHLERRLNFMYKAEEFKFGKNGNKYKELIFPDFKVDLFIANEQNFGLILMIRTGPANYSKNFMVELNRRGQYKVKDGFLWKIQSENVYTKVNVPNETILYETVGFHYLEPKERYLV